MQAQLLTQLIDCFPPPSKAQAMRYVDQDRVYLRRVDENMRRFHILATVRSFENISYHLSVIADFKKKNFSASCGCGEEEPCAHAIAAILAACASFKNPKLYRPAQALELYNLDQPLERSLANWVVQFDAAPRALPKPAKPQDVTFVLNATNDGKGNRLSILTFLAPRSKTRRSANLTAFYPTTEKKRTKITPKSLELMALLALQKNSKVARNRALLLANDKRRTPGKGQ